MRYHLGILFFCLFFFSITNATKKVATINATLDLDQKIEKLQGNRGGYEAELSSKRTKCTLSLQADNTTKKAIVIGATSGMGRQVAKLLATKGGYEVGLASRRLELLQSLQDEIETKTYIKQIDVTHDQAPNLLTELIEKMQGVDLIVITVSTFLEERIDVKQFYKKLIDVDIKGTLFMAETAMRFFEKQNSGHLVLFSSIDGLRGNASCPVYSATKAFVYRYAEGQRNRMKQNKIPIHVTTIVPGWVDNERVTFSQIPGTYWTASTQEAAQQIFEAIEQKKEVAYITKCWWIIAKLLEYMPDWLYNAIGGL